MGGRTIVGERQRECERGVEQNMAHTHFFFLCKHSQIARGI